MKKKSLVLLVCLISAIPLASCNSQDNTPIATATFYLEGGICDNNTEKVYFDYKMNEKTETFIIDPNEIRINNVSRNGYILEGWYLTKDEAGEEITYSDKWDFDTDKMGMDGVSLYAHWIEDVRYSYTLVYLDDDDNEVTLGSYKVNAGDPFSDPRRYARRDGYTALGFFDSEGNPWNTAFTHPGGEESLDIKVYVHYIEGDYALVSDYSSLLSAMRSGRDVYLLNDVDCEGREFSSSIFIGTIEGNNHTISNFVVPVSPNSLVDGNLYVAIFQQLTDATIKDLTFTGVTVTVDFDYSRVHNTNISTIAGKVTNSTLENVNYTGTVTVTRASGSVDFATDVPFYEKASPEDTSSYVNTTVNCTVIDNRVSEEE